MRRQVNKVQSRRDISSLSNGGALQMFKRFLLIFAVALFGFTLTANAQARKNKKNPLAGLWQYVEEKTLPDGQKSYIGKQIYKTITTDNRYFVVLGINIPLKEADSEKTDLSTVTVITQEGEIEFTSGNTYLEYINKHYLDKSLNNTISNLRFKFNEKNPNILYIEYNLGGNEDGEWISEVWLKVLPYGY
jgi:hypothetical protein